MLDAGSVMVEVEEQVGGGLAEWREIDRRLRGYHLQRSALDAAEAFDLVRAEDLKVHYHVGCATFLEYMERHLGHAPHTARERRRVSRALVALPRMSTALATGALFYSHVRELSRVATADTEDAWLAVAEGKNATEVQALVAGHALGDLPDDPCPPDLRVRRMSLELPPEVHALWREARKRLAEERGPDGAHGDITDAELVETLCRRFLQPGTGAEAPAHAIAYTQCRTCKRATQNGAGRAIDVAADVIERAACDARILGDVDRPEVQRTHTSVTPRMREQAIARDGYRCTVPGCRSSRNLEVHHIQPQSNGGPNKLWNLSTLCGGHHAPAHRGLLIVSGTAPNALVFRWPIEELRRDEDPVPERALSRGTDARRWLDHVMSRASHVDARRGGQARQRATPTAAIPPPPHLPDRSPSRHRSARVATSRTRM